MRFWKEFWNPKLKCQRVGHNTQKKTFRVFVKPEEYGWGSGVADSAIMHRTVCTRCNRKFGVDKFTNRQPIHGLSLPSVDMERFELTGILIRHDF